MSRAQRNLTAPGREWSSKPRLQDLSVTWHLDDDSREKPIWQNIYIFKLKDKRVDDMCVNKDSNPERLAAWAVNMGLFFFLFLEFPC